MGNLKQTESMPIMQRSSSPGMAQGTADALYMAKNTTTPVTPTVGQTVSFANNSVDQTIYMTPAGTLATLTIALPSDATSRIGQIVRFSTSAGITLLTVNGASTIFNAPTSLVTGDSYGFQKVAANVWVKL